jgi:uncharacterized OsmC-like protein
VTSTATPVDNGVNVDFLLTAREALSEQPEGANFNWRVSNTWIKGTHSRSSVHGFFGLGAEQTHQQEFLFDGDHPEIFSAEDHGPTPVELLLVSLASCLTAGVAAVAQNREIQLRSVTASLQGDMDIRGILGADPDVRNGFNQISVNYKIDADATQEEIEALVAQSQKRSAVFDAVTNPTRVEVTVEGS